MSAAASNPSTPFFDFVLVAAAILLFDVGGIGVILRVVVIMMVGEQQ